MKILMNAKYLIVLHKAPKPARDELVKCYKEIYKELKHAKVVTKSFKWIPAGVLTQGTI